MWLLYMVPVAPRRMAWRVLQCPSKRGIVVLVHGHKMLIVLSDQITVTAKYKTQHIY